MSELRAIKVTYSDGTEISTNMAAHLTDDQITDYFKVGSWFNLGDPYDCCKDNMQKVVKTEILPNFKLS
jgi:hypothetical protein